MLPRYPAVLLALSFALVGRAAAAPADPADPALNPKGRAILAYFQQLQASPELKLVSGQFCGWSGASSLETLAKIERATGQWPAMIGLDYCAWDKGQAIIDVAPPNELAKNYWHQGGLVTVSWHAPNPANPKGYGGLNDKGVDLQDLLKPGATHDRWMKSLDAVAAGLQELQQLGVVVIWRPLHEMNGDWFWWGGKPGADYVAVWRHMFDYFTHDKQLHNLIWSFGPNNGKKPAANYYAGDAYVDLTGLDVYTDNIDFTPSIKPAPTSNLTGLEASDDIDPRHIKGSADLVALGKPTGLTEFGPHGASNPPGDYDYRRLLDGLEKNFPQARHFLCWDEKWNPAENKFAKEFYNDPRVVTRDRLPAGLAGK